MLASTSDHQGFRACPAEASPFHRNPWAASPSMRHPVSGTSIDTGALAAGANWLSGNKDFELATKVVQVYVIKRK
jgi:hypothetical protein